MNTGRKNLEYLRRLLAGHTPTDAERRRMQEIHEEAAQESAGRAGGTPPVYRPGFNPYTKRPAGRAGAAGGGR